MVDLYQLCLSVEAELRDQGAKQNGNEYTFRCPTPGHPDEHPSASFNSKDGVWYCHGCGASGQVTDLARFMGLPVPQRDVIGYAYESKTGVTLYRVARTGQKKFFQQVPDGNGGWKNRLNGVKPVLFGLPEIYSSDEKDPILVVEGEKDVLTARSLGFVATTNPMGAGKWRDDYSDDLKGRDVVVIPDNDEAGKKHQDDVAKSLFNVAGSVKCLQPLPGVAKKGDLTDWVNNGGTRDDLLKLIENASDHVPRREPDSPFVQLSSVERKQVKWLMEGFIPYGSLTMLIGDPGVGKSFVMAALTASVTRGEGVVTTNTGPRSVILMSAEDSSEYVLGPRLDLMDADTNLVFIELEHLTLDDLGFQRLRKAVDTHNPALVIIDPLTAYLGASTDMYRANEVREFTTRLSVLAEQSEAAVIVVGHLNKGVGRKGIYRASGSIDFVASARTVILAGKGPPTDVERAITVVKSNYAETDVTTGYSIVDGIFRWTGETDLKADDLLSEPSRTDGAPARAEAEEFLREALVGGSLESVRLEELARRRGITSATLRRAKKELGVQAFKVGTGGEGGNGQWFSRLPEAVQDGQDAHDDVCEHLARPENDIGKHTVRVERLADESAHLEIDEDGHIGTHQDVTGSDTELTA